MKPIHVASAPAASPGDRMADHRGEGTLKGVRPAFSTAMAASSSRQDFNGRLWMYTQNCGEPTPYPYKDNFCVFSAPDTAPGWTGTTDVKIESTTFRPIDGWHWHVNAAVRANTGSSRCM